ncbi:MAG: hypothetical protein ACKVS6_16965 [Planctomycetota bacterium]
MLLASMRRISRQLSSLFILLILFSTACVSAGRKTAGEPLTNGHRTYIAKRVSQLRGIPLPASMPFDIKSRQEVAEQFQREAEAQLSEGAVDRRLAADRVLGLLPFAQPGDAPASRPFTRADLGVAGSYDPVTKKVIYVRDLEGGPFSELTVAHEFTHQLDDSRHDLYAMTLAAKGNSDHALAVQSLIEGSAMSTQLDFAMMENYEDSTGTLGGIIVNRTIDDMESDFGIFARLARMRNTRAIELLEITPKYLRERITFPYVRGLAFTRALRQRAGTAAIDAAFENPPMSTEQILHPHKFIDRRDDPTTVELATEWAGAGREIIYEDTLGELGMRQLLYTQFSKRESYEVAEGWGGDRYQVIRIAGRDTLLWHTEWDSEREAREFASAIDRYFSKRYKIASGWMTELCEGDLVRPDGQLIQIRRRGASVAVVDGAPLNSQWANMILDHVKITKPETAAEENNFNIASLARPFFGVDKYKDGGGFNILGGILVSESHRKNSHNFSLLGGALLDVQANGDGDRVSFLFGLISWRTAPRQDLSKWRIGVTTVASDSDSNSWSGIPIVQFPAASNAPGSDTLRTGLINFQSIYKIGFDENGVPTNGDKVAGETSFVLGLTGHGWIDNPESTGTPYRRDYWYGPFEMGFATSSETHGPIITDKTGAESKPASAPAQDRLALRDGDIEYFTKTQSLGEMIFSYESSGLVREGDRIAGITNWSALGGLLASGGRRGDDWLFRTPLAGWAKLGGQEYLLLIWGLISIPMGGEEENK